MAKHIVRPLGLLFFICILPLSHAQAETDRGLNQTQPEAVRQISKIDQRVALVIGNGAYEASPLVNSVNDADDMAVSLKDLGFSVTHLKNASLREMEKSIRDLGKELRRGGVGLFYYAGHGLQVSGINYLVPVDARIYREFDAKYEAVDANWIVETMQDAGNELNIVFLDACRDNRFSRSFRSSVRGLAQIDAPKGIIIAYATAPGSVASDGSGRNGIYTKYLLKHMKSPNITIEQVLKRVRVDVLEETHELQIPWESSSLTGDFYFNRKTDIEENLPNDKAAAERQPASRPAEINEDSNREAINANKSETNRDRKQSIDPGTSPKEHDRQPRNRKLAIFPGLFEYTTKKSDFEPMAYLGYTRLEYSFSEGCYKFFETYQNERLSFSYYHHFLDKIPDIRLIDDLFSSPSDDKLWKKESFFGNRDLNKEFALAKGKEIDADLIILPKIFLHRGGGSVVIYLLDVDSEKIFKKESSLSYYLRISVQDCTLSALKDVFAEYGKQF